MWLVQWTLLYTCTLYTGQVTFYKVPEKHSYVKLVTLYMKHFPPDNTQWGLRCCICSIIYLLGHSLIHLSVDYLCHSFIHLSVDYLCHSFIHSFILWLLYNPHYFILCVRSFFIKSSIYLLIKQSIIYRWALLFIYSFIFS